MLTNISFPKEISLFEGTNITKEKKKENEGQETKNIFETNRQVMLLPQGTRCIAIATNNNQCEIIPLHFRTKTQTYHLPTSILQTSFLPRIQLLRKKNLAQSLSKPVDNFTFSSFVIFGTFFHSQNTNPTLNTNKTFFSTERILSIQDISLLANEETSSLENNFYFLLRFYESFSSVARSLDPRAPLLLQFVFPPILANIQNLPNPPPFAVRNVEWLGIKADVLCTTSWNDSLVLAERQKRKEKENQMFWIQADSQPDIYHLFHKNNKNYAGICAIPSFDCSQFMHSHFKNANNMQKQQQQKKHSIDYVEQSDDDEEENQQHQQSSTKIISSTRNDKREKENNMTSFDFLSVLTFETSSAKLFKCQYHSTQKKWIPVKYISSFSTSSSSSSSDD